MRLAALDSLLSATWARFAVGDALTLADVYLVPQVRNALGAGIDDEAEFPVVDRLWKTCLELPVFRDTLTEMGGLLQPPISRIDDLTIGHCCFGVRSCSMENGMKNV